MIEPDRRVLRRAQPSPSSLLVFAHHHPRAPRAQLVRGVGQSEYGRALRLCTAGASARARGSPVAAVRRGRARASTGGVARDGAREQPRARAVQCCLVIKVFLTDHYTAIHSSRSCTCTETDAITAARRRGGAGTFTRPTPFSVSEGARTRTRTTTGTDADTSARTSSYPWPKAKVAITNAAAHPALHLPRPHRRSILVHTARPARRNHNARVYLRRHAQVLHVSRPVGLLDLVCAADARRRRQAARVRAQSRRTRVRACVEQDTRAAGGSGERPREGREGEAQGRGEGRQGRDGAREEGGQSACAGELGAVDARWTFLHLPLPSVAPRYGAYATTHVPL
ncbi:hypothetical protein EXIGLDRAFT_727712 [Exidia glandulosa HHB12029]|uniref:Uncharacterized protein n=1 Tax=Exidia glandulosa HHB12029 TaxID=1314781 RepID=A0A165D8V1_EXIGL|nr:hypothetical protein EXIGLDRAFT_727712 [Exidia glandulosa HHB12029]